MSPKLDDVTSLSTKKSLPSDERSVGPYPQDCDGPLSFAGYIKRQRWPAVFLASDASSYTNGAELFFDGGLSQG